MWPFFHRPPLLDAPLQGFASVDAGFGTLRSLLWPLPAGVACAFFPGQKEDPEPSRLPDPRRAALLGLIVTLLLVVVGLILVRVLGRVGRLQDCVMAGHTDCAPVSVVTRSR